MSEHLGSSGQDVGEHGPARDGEHLGAWVADDVFDQVWKCDDACPACASEDRHVWGLDIEMTATTKRDLSDRLRELARDLDKGASFGPRVFAASSSAGIAVLSSLNAGPATTAALVAAAEPMTDEEWQPFAEHLGIDDGAGQ